MSYRVEVAPAVRDELRGLPGYVRAQAIRLIDELAIEPRPKRARELRDRPQVMRIWLAGRWRVAYHIDEARHVVRILRVRPKADIHYDTIEPPE